jgi:hypothetical protein
LLALTFEIRAALFQCRIDPHERRQVERCAWAHSGPMSLRLHRVTQLPESSDNRFYPGSQIRWRRCAQFPHLGRYGLHPRCKVFKLSPQLQNLLLECR